MVTTSKNSPINVLSTLYQTFGHTPMSNTQRFNLALTVIAMCMGCYTGVIAPLEQRKLREYACDGIRYLVSRAAFLLGPAVRAYELRVIRIMTKLATTHNKQVYLIIDDTFCVKDRRSKLLAVGGKRGAICGFSFVTAILNVGDIYLPLVPRLALRKTASQYFNLQYVSKVEKAEKLVEHWWKMGLPNKNTTIIVDTWYMSVKFVLKTRSLGFIVVGGVRPNRRFTCKSTSHLKSKKGSSVRDIRKGCHSYQAQKIARNNYEYRLHTRIGTLRGIDEQGVLMLSKRTRLKDNKNTWRFLIIFGQDVSAEKILEIYEHRWLIETFHQVWKQYFNPSNFRVRSSNSRVSYLRLMKLTFFTIVSIFVSCQHLLSVMKNEIYLDKNADDRGFMAIALDKARVTLNHKRGSIKTLFG